MKKKLLAITLNILVLIGMTGCASFSRGLVDLMNNGLERTIVVYAADGQEIAERLTFKKTMDSSSLTTRARDTLTITVLQKVS